ncbi:ZMAT4 protein, partial [Amia calva]|nr:ZMAT4 protein [Amia calva]
MKSTEVDQGLFTDSYCKVCSAQLISESQRVAHYESRKHANKVRLYYMLHPIDGGCPAKKLRTDNGNEEGDVDKNKCCTLCNMSFTSAVVAQSHYQGKIHAKRLKLLLGEQPAITAKGKALNRSTSVYKELWVSGHGSMATYTNTQQASDNIVCIRYVQIERQRNLNFVCITTCALF